MPGAPWQLRGVRCGAQMPTGASPGGTRHLVLAHAAVADFTHSSQPDTPLNNH